MNKKIECFLIDAAMAALMYYGLYIGNEYAANVFWPVFWLFAFGAFLAVIVFNVDDFKFKIKKTRTPRNKWENGYSLIYDTVFAICLAALGFAWPAVIWWIVQLIARSSIIRLDDEIKKETSTSN